MIADEFKEKIIDWQEKLQVNEWFFSDLREDLLRDKTNKEVFFAIDEVVELIIEQKDTTLVYESFLLLFELYWKLDTTERTEKLNTDWNILKNHVCSYSDIHKHQFREFERWFGSKWK